MLEDEISKKRKELDECIKKNRDYDDVYKLSVELDDLITEFYQKKLIKKRRERLSIRDKRKESKILYIA